MAQNLLDLDSDEELTNEGPCEFCEVCFPFELLIEHQSGCRPDLLHFPNEKESIQGAKVSDLKTKALKTELEVQKASDKIFRNVASSEVPEIKDSCTLSSKTKTVEQSIVSDNTLSRAKAYLGIGDSNLMVYGTKNKEVKASEKLQNSEGIGGSKLMVYGTKNEEVEESEKLQSFEVPSLSLLNNADQRKLKVVESEFFTNEESGESLEDFWRRAEIVLHQRKMKRW